MFKLTKQFWRQSKGEGKRKRSPKTESDTPSPNYSWLEIVPMMILLIIIAGILAFAPTLDYVPFSKDKIDLENVFNNTAIELP